ncbi:hypothetical protein [Dactylosporangium sp. NPDC051541]|uniref:hypothetical protein n=1 Tax=Dactylosporangium sp. NPDC051541 TaxID=3363977 RepID=UPI00378A2B72
MPKDIAVVSYDLDPTSALTTDAVVVRDVLNAAGYSAQLVHQWAFNEPDRSTFKPAAAWERYDGVVICNFYGAWNVRELVRAARPAIVLNVGYADDFGIGETQQEHTAEDVFTVTDPAHPITSGAGLPAGTFNAGAPVFFDSVSTLNHHVDVLVTSLANQAVLTAHKTEPLTYFAWYRLSAAPASSPLRTLLVQAANWTFAGP